MPFVFVLLCSLLLAGPALAQTPSNLPVFPSVPKHYMARFVQGTDTAGTYKTIITGNATGNNLGTRCHALYIISDSTAGHNVTFRLSRGGSPFPGPLVAVGTTRVPVDVFTTTVWPGLPPDSDGGRFIHLQAGDLLEATYATALSAGAVIGVHADCWDW